MTVSDSIYGKVLFELNVSVESVNSAKEIITSSKELVNILSNPTIKSEKKYNIIKKIFPKEIYSFICVVCRNGLAERLLYIFEEYYNLYQKNCKIVKAVVRYVTPLTAQQQEGIKKFAIKKSGFSDVELCLEYAPDIIGGFILNIGDFEYDRSYRTQLKNMQNNLKGR